MKMNRLDKKYTDLLQDILDNGVVKMTVLALVRFQFGRQITHDMKDGFPLLTKKMPFKTIFNYNGSLKVRQTSSHYLT
jgi:thymidylate synthase